MRTTPWSPSSKAPSHATSARPRRRGRFLGSERAQGLVEFALVLPLFLVLLLATIDFGNGLRHYMVMTNAAREGARYGAVGNTQADIVTKVVNYGDTVGIAAGDVTVTNAEGDSGEEITVSVSKNYNYITPLGGILGVLSGGTLPDPLPLSASATMRLE